MTDCFAFPHTAPSLLRSVLRTSLLCFRVGAQVRGLPIQFVTTSFIHTGVSFKGVGGIPIQRVAEIKGKDGLHRHISLRQHVPSREACCCSTRRRFAASIAKEGVEMHSGVTVTPPALCCFGVASWTLQTARSDIGIVRCRLPANQQGAKAPDAGITPRNVLICLRDPHRMRVICS